MGGCKQSSFYYLSSKKLQVTRNTARKPRLGSLTIKEATGDMGCMQASFGLSIKTDYRCYRRPHAKLI